MLWEDVRVCTKEDRGDLGQGGADVDVLRVS